MRDWTNEELQRILAEVTRRSALSSEFRALALKDAAAAIFTISPKPLPKEITIRFVDNSGATKTVPLPDLVQDSEDELSEEDLDDVAGGGDPPPLAGGWSKIASLGKRTKNRMRRRAS